MRIRQPLYLGLGPLIGSGLGFLVGAILVLRVGSQVLIPEGWEIVGFGFQILAVAATTLAGMLLGLIAGTILSPPPYNWIGAILLAAIICAAGAWWLFHARDRRDGRFLRAMQRDNQTEMARMIAEGFPLSREIHGYSPLLWALEWRHLDSAKFLVRNGAEVNVLWPGKGSALVLAAGTGDLELVAAMLAHGADPYLADHGRDIPELLSHGPGWPKPEMRALLAGALLRRPVGSPVRPSRAH